MDSDSDEEHRHPKRQRTGRQRRVASSDSDEPESSQPRQPQQEPDAPAPAADAAGAGDATGEDIVADVADAAAPGDATGQDMADAAAPDEDMAAADGGADDETGSQASLIDFLTRPRDDGSSSAASRVSKDFLTVSDTLRNRGPRAINLDFRPFMDPYRLLYPAAEAVGTMDAVHKCLQIIPEGDPSLLTQPCDGYSWAFMARCIGSSVPEHIEKALYFFYRVLSAVESQGYTHFAVPTGNLVPQWDRQSKKSVVAIAERQERVPAEERSAAQEDGSNTAFSLASVIGERMANMEGDQLNIKAPFSLRMGFTGAFFNDGPQKQQVCRPAPSPSRLPLADSMRRSCTASSSSPRCATSTCSPTSPRASSPSPSRAPPSSAPGTPSGPSSPSSGRP